MKIIELYSCIQGEGKFIGVPHILVRLSGCNLNCQFSNSICDTPYASWDTERETNTFSKEDLHLFLHNHPQINWVLITGGEPFMNHKLADFILDLKSTRNIKIAIETNGTIFSKDVVDLVDFITISPKLKTSTPRLDSLVEISGTTIQVEESMVKRHELGLSCYKQTIPKFIESLKMTTTPKGQFKFVITCEEDVREVIKFRTSHRLPNEVIYLMPSGTTNEKLAKLRTMVIDLAIQFGFNYTDRLHIVAFDGKRGY